jgi:hypothetical protein
MTRWLVSVLFGALPILATAGQAPGAGAQYGQSASQAPATAVQANGAFTTHIAKALDSKKLKEGDVVEAKLDGDISVPGLLEVPRGTPVIGHVIQAKARSNNDSESTLRISFDKLAFQGREMPIQGVIRAVAPGTGPSSRSALGHGSTANDQLWGAPDPEEDPTPILTTASRGVLGIRNLKLGPDGTLSSSDKEVKLASGTRMIIEITIPISRTK